MDKEELPPPPVSTLTQPTIDHHFPKMKRNIWLRFIGLPGCGKTKTIEDLLPNVTEQYAATNLFCALFAVKYINAFYDNPKQNAYTLQMKGLERYEETLSSISDNQNVLPRHKKFSYFKKEKPLIVIEHTALELISFFTDAFYSLGFLSKANLEEIEAKQKDLFARRESLMSGFKVLRFEFLCESSVAVKNVIARDVATSHVNHDQAVFSSIMSKVGKLHVRAWSSNNSGKLLSYTEGLLPTENILRTIKCMPVKKGQQEEDSAAETTPAAVPDTRSRKRMQSQTTGDNPPPAKRSADTPPSPSTSSQQEQQQRIITPQEKLTVVSSKGFGQYVPLLLTKPVFVPGSGLAPNMCMQTDMLFVSAVDVHTMMQRIEAWNKAQQQQQDAKPVIINK